MLVYLFRPTPDFCAVTVGLWKVCSASEELQFVLPMEESKLQALVVAIVMHVRQGHPLSDGLVVEGLCTHQLKFIRTIFRAQPVLRAVIGDPEHGFDPERMRDPWRQQLP